MSKKIEGSIFLLISTVIYGLFGVLSRYIASFAPFSQSWIKAFFTGLLALFIMIFGKLSWKKIRREDIKWFALWILPGSFQPALTFLAFNHLPIGMTYFLLYSTMILGGIISGALFFSEKLSFNKVFSMALLLSGIFLIYGSDLTLAGNIYVLFALLAGMILGFWNTLTKKVSGHYSEYQMILLDSGTSLILCLLISIFLSEKIVPLTNFWPWIWIFVYSVFALGAGAFLIKGFKYVEAQVGSLIMPMEIVFGAIFGFLFFGEILRVNAYVGGIFIFTAAVFSTFGTKSDIEPN